MTNMKSFYYNVTSFQLYQLLHKEKQIKLFKLQICPPRIKGKRNIRIYLSMNVNLRCVIV